MSYGSPNQSGGGWNPNAPPPTSQSGAQWNPNAPTSQPNQQQPQWAPQPPNPNAPNQYQPQQQPQQQVRPGSNTQLPQPVAPGPPPPQTLQPNNHPDQYNRAPGPSLPPLGYPPYQQAPMGYPPTQPAPRQRTAIACRYCRRRKIRCSGFEQSEDGRCTNCVRFSQECVFTPVSAQTQAFVPAHTVWRGQNPPPNTQLYGAYGQPLPQGGRTDQYSPQQQGQPQQPGQYPPGPPQGYQQQPQMYPQQGPNAGSKRPNDEPHTPTLPPPNPGAQSQMPQQHVDGQYGYPNAPEKGEPVTIAGANERREEALRNGQIKDVGVQVEIIKPDGKEQAS